MERLVTLLLLQYNNYYNRIVKKLDTLEEYVNVGPNYKFIQRVNFNPNDGVNTEQIINWNESFNPDYCVIINDSNEVVSRWFITESVRTRGGQFKLSLQRDVIVDHYKNVVQAPCYIEKATIVNPNDPLIFNNEGLQLNQIKKGELFLTDNTRVPWIVGYMSKNRGADLQVTVETTPPGSGEYISESAATINEFKYKQYEGSIFPTSLKDNWATCQFYVATKNNTTVQRLFSFDTNNYQVNYGQDGTSNIICRVNGDRTKFNPFRKQLQEAYDKDDFLTAARSSAGLKTASDLSDLMSYDNKIIKTLDNKFYKIEVYDAEQSVAVTFNTPNSATAFVFDLLDESSLSRDIETEHPERIQFSFYYLGKKIRITEIPNSSYTAIIKIPSASRPCADAVYDMFAMPLPVNFIRAGRPFEIAYPNSLDPNIYDYIQPTYEDTIRWLTKLLSSYYADIYDVQILPYCPIPKLAKASSASGSAVNRIWPLSELSTDEYSWIEDSAHNRYGIIIFPEFSNISFDVAKTNIVNKDGQSNIPSSVQEPLKAKDSALELKIQNETEFIRLVSPTYQGQFEFSVAKNGTIEYFNVDMTLKPFNPYIHINPNFGGLYGTDFNDTRGLICLGDFSFPRTEDKFADYQLQNKNYEAIFNRQIENMEVNNKIANKQAAWSAGAGAITGAASGALTGAMVSGGNPVGAIVGGVVGGGASAVGGIADIRLQKQAQAESISYATDLFNYSLQNIRALPYSLTKNTSLTYNSKYFPFLEMYKCTDAEINALKEKIRYNGMTVMRIGTIDEFIRGEKTFVQGQIIRLEDLGDDNHMAEAIYNEIAKGVYI